MRTIGRSSFAASASRSSDGKGGWRTIADEREAVPFGVETRDAFIAIDESAIAEGLVAIPRESTGVLSDLPAELLEGIDDLPPADTPARLVIEQLSAVEHATVCGTPVLRDGSRRSRPAWAGRWSSRRSTGRCDAPAGNGGNRPRVIAAAAADRRPRVLAELLPG